MCQTQWEERHSLMEDFDNMYTPLRMCLEDRASNKDTIWNGKAISEVQGLTHYLYSRIIAAFKVYFHMFGYTKPLSCLLQGSTMDVITSYKEIHLVKKIFTEMRKEPGKEFKPMIFDSMLAMAEIDGLSVMLVSRATPLNQKGKRGLVTACTASCIRGMQ